MILIDLTMAGDNVVIMGTLTSGLPAKDRRRVIMLGVAMALVFLIGFALVATQLLKITGLLLAGGLLLLWVAYNMYRELRPGARRSPPTIPDTEAVEGPPATKTFLGRDPGHARRSVDEPRQRPRRSPPTAREHPAVLFVGLALSVTMMGLAANIVARLVQRYHWIAWVGLLMILYVAGKMIWEGLHQFGPTAAMLALEVLPAAKRGGGDR